MASEKDSGGGQWLPPAGAGMRQPSEGISPRKAVRPCFPEKRLPDRRAARTKTDTGGRVQGYQGAREKPR